MVLGADRKLAANDEVLASLFFATIAVDPTTNLYKLFIDSKTRKIDIGAKQIFNNVSDVGGNPIYIAFTDVAPANLTDEKLTIARGLIIDEIKRIVEGGLDRATQVLSEHIDQLHTVAGAPLEYETLTGDESRKLNAGEDMDRPPPGDKIQSVPESGQSDPKPPPTTRPFCRPAPPGGADRPNDCHPDRPGFRRSGEAHSCDREAAAACGPARRLRREFVDEWRARSDPQRNTRAQDSRTALRPGGERTQHTRQS